MLRKKVQVVVFDLSQEQSKILLLKTNQSRGGFWQNITGSVQENESILSAAKRELCEETGLTVNVHDLEYFFEFDNIREHLFGVALYKTPKIILDSREHSDFKWMLVKDVTSADFRYRSNYDSFLVAKTRIFN